jgi:hypothetical protein
VLFSLSYFCIYYYIDFFNINFHLALEMIRNWSSSVSLASSPGHPLNKASTKTVKDYCDSHNFVFTICVVVSKQHHLYTPLLAQFVSYTSTNLKNKLMVTTVRILIKWLNLLFFISLNFRENSWFNIVLLYQSKDLDWVRTCLCNWPLISIKYFTCWASLINGEC